MDEDELQPDSDAVVVLSMVVHANKDGSFTPMVETDLSPEIVETLLRQTADTIAGKDDRATGAWGRHL